jgi:hypothetical protein
MNDANARQRCLVLEVWRWSLIRALRNLLFYTYYFRSSPPILFPVSFLARVTW